MLPLDMVHAALLPRYQILRGGVLADTGLEDVQGLARGVETRMCADRQGCLLLAVPDRQVVERGDAEGPDEVVEDLLKTERVAGSFRPTVGVLADDDARALLDGARGDELGQHPVDLVGFTMDVLE